ncbi:helix-turn-helix domain-containing protein [Pseudomonas amygdali]|uniref:RodZ domain-containing protein n=1 Tax=Pseudomonas amygdali TaxID=47877 RepID=UPI0006B88056|nr:RodZ family helix-turn-helix domain-containing protein [Pseudomonas amygdali]KPB31917.1 Cro/CI family transcriptional regulator [Pseudomonas amygdali pv. sesami]KPY62867.1 Cro/CI family transcriptional regulator [Pseudomonas amygdali pv. sesami]RMT97812.1 Cro/CI family transcriptional regulator [Pseudomonas amygdali pv. sesami]RMU00252.1 Cro/CI family transcriptional regulator [Pseudomonas amygdali pv. sesami]RMV87592.1 putative membrane protein [Pseudomonas amygdali pv. sesami]
MKAAHPEVVATTRVNPGETLRQVRESRSWSLPDVALRLNLTVTSLSNLENGHFEKLPGHTFARGYVRAYAKLLDLDQAALVEQFDQFTGTDGKGSSVHALGRIEEPVRLSHNILRIVSLLLLVLLVGGGFFWWQDQASLRGRDQSGLNMEHVEVESADGTTQIHPLDEPEEPAVAETPTAGQTSLPLNTGAPASESPSATPAAPTADVTSHAPAQTPATATPPANAPQAPVAAPTVPSMPTAPAEQPAPVMAGAGQVTVQFVADCWTQVTDGNGKVLVSGLKRKGDSLDVSGKPPLTLRLGYARGAQVSYNGQPVDVAPFTSGETARLKLGQ